MTDENEKSFEALDRARAMKTTALTILFYAILNVSVSHLTARSLVIPYVLLFWFFLCVLFYLNEQVLARALLMVTLLFQMVYAVGILGGYQKDFAYGIFHFVILACALTGLFGRPGIRRSEFIFAVAGVAGLVYLCMVGAGLFQEYRARLALVSAPWVGEYRSPKNYRITLPSRKWKFVPSDAVAPLAGLDARKADILVASSDGNCHVLFFGTPTPETAEVNKGRKLLLRHFAGETIDEAAEDPLSVSRRATVTGTQYVEGVAYTYVGFQKILPGIAVDIILRSESKNALPLFEKLELFLEHIEELPDAYRGQSKSPKEIYDLYQEAVVLVKAKDRRGRVLQIGSGFNLSPKGVILTNLHVVNVPGRASLEVEFPTRGTYEHVVLVGAGNAVADLALLRFAGKDLPTVGNLYWPHVEVGDEVAVIGNPNALVNTLSPGIVSGLRSRNGVALYQITAPISGGSSGGPVFNAYGEVVGVATASFASGQNLNFCVSIKEVERIKSIFSLESLAKGSRSDSGKASIDPEREINAILSRHPKFPTPQHIKVAIAQTYQRGAQIFNRGDHDLCYQLYDGIARRIVASIDPMKDSSMKRRMRDVLLRARYAASKSPNPGKAAWELGQGYEVLLKMK